AQEVGHLLGEPLPVAALDARVAVPNGGTRQRREHRGDGAEVDAGQVHMIAGAAAADVDAAAVGGARQARTALHLTLGVVATGVFLVGGGDVAEDGGAGQEVVEQARAVFGVGIGAPAAVVGGGP